MRIGSKSELPRLGTAKEFRAGDKTLCVANVNGVICALNNECPHRGGPLAEGLIEEGMIVCPWHAWAFDPFTGEASHFPKAKVEVYELRTEGEEVFVDLES